MSKRRHRNRRSPRRSSILTLLAAAVIAIVTLIAGDVSVFSLFAKAEEGQVVAVIDGDTIDVMQNGKKQRIRLSSVDAPEKTQAYGRKAREFASSLCHGKKVTIRVTDHDRYDRIVGEVILPDQRSLNRELVRAGYAWWYKKYSNDPGLGALQQEAQEGKRGLWAGKHPVPPWEFREERR